MYLLWKFVKSCRKLKFSREEKEQLVNEWWKTDNEVQKKNILFYI